MATNDFYENFEFEDRCTFCHERCYYPYKLHGVLGFFYACKNCTQKGWEHYQNYHTGDSWEPDTKAKTLEEFMVLVARQRNLCIDKKIELAAARKAKEIEEMQQRLVYENKLKNKVDTVFNINIQDLILFDLESHLYEFLKKHDIELLKLEKCPEDANKLIASCDKSIPFDLTVLAYEEIKRVIKWMNMLYS